MNSYVSLDVSSVSVKAVDRRTKGVDVTAGRNATASRNLGETGRKAVDTAADKKAVTMLDANLIVEAQKMNGFLNDWWIGSRTVF